MQKVLLSFLVFLQFPLAQAQSDTIFVRYDKNQFDTLLKYEVDTFIYKTPKASLPLVGTTILPWTSNQQIAKGYGLFLKSVHIGQCEHTERPPLQDEVLEIIETDSSLVIRAKIIGNCCHDFLCDVQIVDSHTINLVQYGYGNTYCACFCCFGLSYEFLIEQFEEYHKLEYVMLNGDSKTLKKK